MPDRQKRSKKAAILPNKVVPIHEGAGPVRASLDDTDLAIVRALQANARATYTEIGKAVGLAAASVHERVHRLETRGVIRGYHAEVDPERLGLAGPRDLVGHGQHAQPSFGHREAHRRGTMPFPGRTSVFCLVTVRVYPNGLGPASAR